MSVVGSFLTIDYRQLFTLKKQSYIHQTAEHQLYFLLLLTAFNRTAYGIEIFKSRCLYKGRFPFNRTAYEIERQEYPINSKRDLIHQYSIQTISIFRSCFLYVQ